MRPWVITLTVEDEKGSKSPVRAVFSRPDITGPADSPIPVAQVLAELLDPLIAGRITGLSLTTQLALPPGLKATAEPDSDVEEGLTLLYRSANNFFFSQTLPTIREQYAIDNLPLDVDELRYFVRTMCNDWGDYDGRTVYPVTARGEMLQRLARSQVVFRRSRR